MKVCSLGFFCVFFCFLCPRPEVEEIIDPEMPTSAGKTNFKISLPSLAKEPGKGQLVRQKTKQNKKSKKKTIKQ